MKIGIFQRSRRIGCEIMTYDTEKYRSKREKVLGIKKRGMSFGVIAAIVSFCIIVVLGFIVLPETIAYIVERNLDDAIYKVEKTGQWSHEVMTEIHEIDGVVEAVTDKGGKRLIITFNRNEVDLGQFSSFFRNKGLKPTLLNRVNHRQRVTTLQEEKELEAI